MAVVTGANTGLGYETAKALAERGASVVLTVRNVEKGEQAAARMTGDVTVQALDLMLPLPVSRGHRIRAAIHFDDLQWERSYSRAAAYGQSKLANLMFTYEPVQHRARPQQPRGSPQSYEAVVQQRLWAVSEGLTGVPFPIPESKQSPFPSGSATTL